MPQCAVVGCNNTHRRTKGGSVKYHRFPGDSGTRSQWLQACGKTLNNCSTARICSRHFSEDSYERDVQHELLGLPTRCRLKRGAIPDRNLPDDFLKEEKRQESAIDILLAVGLVPARSKSGNYIGGLPEDLNKMQIMEDVREGCDANLPSSPGHAEQGQENVALEEVFKEKKDIVVENGVKKENDDDDDDVDDDGNEDDVKKEADPVECQDQDEDSEDRPEENRTPTSIRRANLENNFKRKLDSETGPLKRLKSDLEENFITRDKIMNDFIEAAECSNLEQIQTLSDHLLNDIKTLQELAKEKEREWNKLLHLKKLKEELQIRLQRKRQILIANGGNDLNDFQPEANGQQSLLKCNQKVNMLKELRAANIEKLRQRTSLLQNPYKQKPMLDVQSIIADYRQRHPETVPRRGRRIRHSQNGGKSSSLGFSGGSLTVGQSTDCNDLTSNGLQDSSWCQSSYKDILLQFAKLSQSEKSELQMQLQNSSKPPPPYPEVTVHPVTSTSSITPSNSLLHGILTKGPLRQPSPANGAAVNGGQSSFSPTLARLLTAPEKSGGNNLTSTPNILAGTLMNCTNMSISDIFSGSKVRNEITITPVGSQFESGRTQKTMEDESEDQADRLVIDESLENPNSVRCKEDNRSDDGEDVPQCQGCNQKAAQFVCAGCGNQWYCSRNCQVAAWDDHSEVCSG